MNNYLRVWDDADADADGDADADAAEARPVRASRRVFFLLLSCFAFVDSPSQAPFFTFVIRLVCFSGLWTLASGL